MKIFLSAMWIKCNNESEVSFVAAWRGGGSAPPPLVKLTPVVDRVVYDPTAPLSPFLPLDTVLLQINSGLDSPPPPSFLSPPSPLPPPSPLTFQLRR